MSDKRRDRIIRQLPVLKKIPNKDQLSVFNKAVKSPILIGSALLLLITFFSVQAFTIMEIALSPSEQVTQSFIANGFNTIKKLFFPVLLPLFVIMAIILFIRNRLVIREVKKYIRNNKLSKYESK